MDLGAASDGLLATVAGGGFALLFRWLDRRHAPRRRDVWQSQAEELRDELRRQHEESTAYLRQQLADAQRENVRLNRLLNRKRSGHD